MTFPPPPFGTPAPTDQGPAVFSIDLTRRVRRLLTRSPFYVDDTAFLRVFVQNVKAGVTVTIAARIGTIDGQIKGQIFTVTPPSDRSRSQTDFLIGEGLLYNVTAFASAGSPSIGQTFVQVQLMQASGATGIILASLIANYVTATQAPGYPITPVRTSIETGGYYRAISGTQPATGHEIKEICPTGARWNLIAVNATLTPSDGNSRWVRLFINNSAFVCYFGAQRIIGPGNTLPYNMIFSQTPELSEVVVLSVNYSFQPIANPTFLLAGDFFTTNTANLAGLDVYLAPAYLVQEFLEVN